MRRAVLAEVDMPAPFEPLHEPALDPTIYTGRLERLRNRLAVSGLDALMVYADREHQANIAWLTGFDPRFEEALLIVRSTGTPVLLTGLECQGVGRAAPVTLDVRLYRPFGLMGQERRGTEPLHEVLSAAGIRSGDTLGVAGWKYYGAQETAAGTDWLEIPSFIADTVRLLTGPGGRVVNAGSLLMDPATGLRTDNEIDQLARFEFAASHTGAAIHRVVTGTKPGMREFEAARLWQPMGLPHSCHAMLASGPRAWLGLTSATSKIIEQGDAIGSGYGVWGALSCRAGWMAQGPEDLPAGVRDYIQKLIEPYYEAAVAWLETMDIGVTGDQLNRCVHERIGDPFFGLFLNPGHLIGLDEWLNSPIAEGSTTPMRSGMAIQLDIIPATGGPYFTSNLEDGIALLDQLGRDALRDRHPDAWARIVRRRTFMIDVLGIRLQPAVLPLSDITGWLPPFWLSHGQAMVMR
jgi:Creatinase/Prolidase N-terminal domain